MNHIVDFDDGIEIVCRTWFHVSLAPIGHKIYIDCDQTNDEHRWRRQWIIGNSEICSHINCYEKTVQDKSYPWNTILTFVFMEEPMVKVIHRTHHKCHFVGYLWIFFGLKSNFVQYFFVLETRYSNFFFPFFFLSLFSPKVAYITQSQKKLFSIILFPSLIYLLLKLARSLVNIHPVNFAFCGKFCKFVTFRYIHYTFERFLSQFLIKKISFRKSIVSNHSWLDGFFLYLKIELNTKQRKNHKIRTTTQLLWNVFFCTFRSVQQAQMEWHLCTHFIMNLHYIWSLFEAIVCEFCFRLKFVR